MSHKPKPVDSITLVVGLVDFFKSAAIVLGMTIIEWARAKQAQAEDRLASAETDLAAEKAKNEIDKNYQERVAPDIVREFLDERKSTDP